MCTHGRLFLNLSHEFTIRIPSSYTSFSLKNDIEQTVDGVTIKKQYRKLAVLLHPDKNKFAGAEADSLHYIDPSGRLNSYQRVCLSCNCVLWFLTTEKL